MLSPLWSPAADLEALLRRKVDLVPKKGLHRDIRDEVLASAQVLYAA
jgi:predicted nucleotidyltransferase